jgi:hypothetical protein
MASRACVASARLRCLASSTTQLEEAPKRTTSARVAAQANDVFGG